MSVIPVSDTVVHWYCLMPVTDTVVHWYCLVPVTDTVVHWYCLVPVTDTVVHWYCLVPVTDTVVLHDVAPTAQCKHSIQGVWLQYPGGGVTVSRGYPGGVVISAS